MENISTNILMEPNKSQLRQLVLENTKKIEKQEVLMEGLRVDNTEFSRQMREQYEWLRNFRKELDDSMRCSRERMDRLERFSEISKLEHEKSIRELKNLCRENSKQMKDRDERFDKDMKEREENFAKEMKERGENFAKEMKDRDERFDRDMKERDENFAKEMKERGENFAKEMKERDEKFAEEMKEFRDDVNASIRRISVEFLGATGHIVEGLASSAVDNIFKEAGLDLLHYGKNIKPKQPEANNKMEVDVLLGNETFVVPVEVKADFTKRKVKRFIRRMSMFRTFFPEYADKEVVAAVAAINYEDGTDQLAHKEGLLVIRVSSDDIFSLDPFDVKTLHRF